MTTRELEFMWRFWSVGKYWFGQRLTGEQVRAGTRNAALNKAEWFELRHQ